MTHLKLDLSTRAVIGRLLAWLIEWLFLNLHTSLIKGKYSYQRRWMAFPVLHSLSTGEGGVERYTLLLYTSLLWRQGGCQALWVRWWVLGWLSMWVGKKDEWKKACVPATLSNSGISSASPFLSQETVDCSGLWIFLAFSKGAVYIYVQIELYYSL